MPKRSGDASTSSTAIPSTVTPTARPALPLDDADDRRRGLEPLERVRRSRDERELVDGLAPAAGLACDLGAELVRERLRECARPVQRERPPPRPLASEAREDLLLRRRPDARCLAQPAGCSRLPQLVRRADPERATERDHALRPETDEAPECDELRLDLALELLQLDEPAGRDELRQPALDAGPDAAQLARTPGPDEILDRDARLADELGGAAICAHRVVPGAGQVEQCRIGLQGLRDLGVRHASG